MKVAKRNNVFWVSTVSKEQLKHRLNRFVGWVCEKNVNAVKGKPRGDRRRWVVLTEVANKLPTVCEELKSPGQSRRDNKGNLKRGST